jgi:uncharacterized damage-inducible protein DinB
VTFEPPPLPEDPPFGEGEREMLESFLDYYRTIILRKVGGLSLEDATKRLVPSDSTLLGIVKHLGYVERTWFQARLHGQDLPVPWTDDDPDADFRIEPNETIETVAAWYKDQCERSRQLSAVVPSVDRMAKAAGPTGTANLRWILVHMVEETARHAGHMDILREQIDGAMGD